MVVATCSYLDSSTMGLISFPAHPSHIAVYVSNGLCTTLMLARPLDDLKAPLAVEISWGYALGAMATRGSRVRADWEAGRADWKATLECRRAVAEDRVLISVYVGDHLGGIRPIHFLSGLYGAVVLLKSISSRMSRSIYGEEKRGFIEGLANDVLFRACFYTRRVPRSGCVYAVTTLWILKA